MIEGPSSPSVRFCFFFCQKLAMSEFNRCQLACLTSPYTYQLHSQNLPPGGRIVPSKFPLVQPCIAFLSMILFISENFKYTKQYRTGDASQLAEGLCSIYEPWGYVPGTTKPGCAVPCLEPYYCRGMSIQVPDQQGVQTKFKVTLN